MTAKPPTDICDPVLMIVAVRLAAILLAAIVLHALPDHPVDREAPTYVAAHHHAADADRDLRLHD